MFYDSFESGKINYVGIDPLADGASPDAGNPVKAIAVSPTVLTIFHYKLHRKYPFNGVICDSSFSDRSRDPQLI
ncbi:hypothetical protein M3J09_005402 [Ascochyta lentis]